jgi:ABC-2 type transport system permease protein
MSASPGLAASVLKLLRLRVIILINTFRRAKKRTKILYALVCIGILMLLWFILLISMAVLGFLHSPQLAEHGRNAKLFLESIPSIVMSIAGCGILVTSFSVLLQALYLSEDMDFLMSTPIPIRAVFIAKLVQAVLPNFILLCIIALPILFGLGISSGYHIFYFPFTVILLAAIALSAASLASLLVLFVARFFRPRRIAEVLGFIIGLSCFIGSQMAPRFMDYGFEQSHYGQMGVVFKMLGRFNSPWLPLAWAGRGLVELGKNALFPALCWISASLFLTGIVVCTALVASERLYYSGWASLQNNSRKSRKQIRIKSFGTFPLLRMLSPPARAILVKDFRLYRRDLRSLSGLLFPMILGVIYALGLVRSHWQMPTGRGKAPPGFIQAGNLIFFYADIGVALFLGWMLVSNMAGLAFSREGRSYWMLKAAPIGTRQLLTAKFLVGYLPSALICSIYLLVLEVLKGAGIGSIITGIISIWIMMGGLTGIYLALGTRGAKFNWENPAQVFQIVGCLGMLISILFLPICFGFFIGPAILAQLLHFPAAAGRLAGLLLGGAICALAVVIPLALVEKRVSSLSEE